MKVSGWLLGATDTAATYSLFVDGPVLGHLEKFYSTCRGVPCPQLGNPHKKLACKVSVHDKPLTV